MMLTRAKDWLFKRPGTSERRWFLLWDYTYYHPSRWEMVWEGIKMIPFIILALVPFALMGCGLLYLAHLLGF